MTATASAGLQRFGVFPTAGTRLHAVPEELPGPIPATVGHLSVASNPAVVSTLLCLGEILVETFSDLRPPVARQLYFDLTKAAEIAQLERRTFSPPQGRDYWWLPRDLSREDFALESPEWLTDAVGDLRERGFRRRNDPRFRY